MELFMKPLVFTDSYWTTNRRLANDLHEYVRSLPTGEFRQLVKLLKLEALMHGNKTYYVVPATTAKQFKEANKIVQWHKMPKNCHEPNCRAAK